MEQDAIISVRGLTAAYGDDVILKDVSFDGEARRGVCHPGRVGLREEHFAKAFDRIVSPGVRARS